MIKKRYNTKQASLMDRRFSILKSNMDYIAEQYDKDAVLYPMMERPIYSDFETLIMSTIEDAELGGVARGDGSDTEVN